MPQQSLQLTMRMEGLNGTLQMFDALAKFSDDMRPFLRKCIAVIRHSTAKTFHEGGRPVKWPDRWKAIESVFPNLYKQKKGVLRVTGVLRESVLLNSEGTMNNGYVALTNKSLTYGTKLEYAATQQFGGKSKVQVPEDKIKYIGARKIWLKNKGSKKKRNTDIAPNLTESKAKLGPPGTPYVLLHDGQKYYARKLDPDGTFTINVRPRPFLMIQPEDVAEIKMLMAKSISDIIQKKAGV